MAEAAGKTPLATEETFLAAYTGRRSRRQVHDRELLTFQLGDAPYAIDIQSLREISRLVPITELPKVPPFIEGIITLRGQVICVLDLRRRMRLPTAPLGRAARILIIESDGDAFGLIVDRVLRVERVTNAQIESAPLPGGVASEFVAGIARSEDELIVLVDLPTVVGFSLEART